MKKSITTLTLLSLFACSKNELKKNDICNTWTAEKLILNDKNVTDNCQVAKLTFSENGEYSENRYYDNQILKGKWEFKDGRISITYSDGKTNAMNITKLNEREFWTKTGGSNNLEVHYEPEHTEK